ncbi:MAG: GNAT family N-acetyltransferase [Gammaproteobacteria bacterium]|nr:GNAT family N-acetyltransferase [Gammaproteobacteria bacterium]
MDDLHLEIFKDDNSELEKYLSDSIISYGIEQLKGNEPKKLYCCYRNSNGKIVAGIMGSATLNLFFVSHLFVEPEHRNNGLGTRLLSEIEKLAHQAGCNTLRINTLNKNAHDLYINAGFEETICIPDYMNGFDLVYYHKKTS